MQNPEKSESPKPIRRIRPVHIALYSDFICPWCYIAKARIERIRNILENEVTIEVSLRPFLLYPDIPAEGAPKEDFRTATKPGIGRSLRTEAALEGILLRYDLISRIPNTVQAHRLIDIMGPGKKSIQVATTIFKAYFNEGRDIGNRDILMSIARFHDVPSDIIDLFYNADHNVDSLSAKLIAVRKAGIASVPHLKLNDVIPIPGLQEDEVWINYFRRAARVNDNLSMED